ncbi:MAG: marR 2 [Actinomycetia bacterium]|nr:marR 2 [Actinomycetes bacterium]
MTSLEDRLSRLSRLNTVAIEARAAASGMTASEAAVLGMLTRVGPVLSPTRLQVLVIQSPGGLTKTLRRLEDAGLVRRRADPDDRRSLLVELTAKGRRASERTSAEVGAHYDEVLAGLDTAERATLDDLLRSLLDRLEQATGHRPGLVPDGLPRHRR